MKQYEPLPHTAAQGGHAARIAVTVVLALSLGACSSMSHREKSTVLGTAIGGAVGAAATGGSTVGTVGGAVVGGVVGNELGKKK